ncbi:MAG: nitroreductase [Erysipelotrichaceae bacterium]|nr:nitroreductase [Erysipelotrichaceae bacterium]
MNLYNQIYKRKSFHHFKNTIPLSETDLKLINNILNNVFPLDNTIKFKIKLVKESETSCNLGAEYCILFYSEKTDFYLENIGYIGEQIDLYLTLNNIGTLWCGLGKTKTSSLDGLDYVIMICIAKVPETAFRNDLSLFKRKNIAETWNGDLLPFSETIILAPSAVNSQPWYTKKLNNELFVYRNNKAAKFGIIPLKIMKYYNQIDMGIYLYLLEVCFKHHNYSFIRILFKNYTKVKSSKILTAKYSFIDNNKL